ncbi:hypothetical protein CA850_29760 [Micromonospora echinospora]|uniref:Phage-related protein n=1 Tax=Micromonospora echinospora TaxID=1877 RepID=A0A1C5AAW5_MICEC|nr:hypothetical protein [Micromonospora echinospora]OZV74766.1 hypothetical protein CA850_29760 [Micromonospora echinospora]SCF42357.1 Phage-related protein [Micromonospora echinospora]
MSTRVGWATIQLIPSAKDFGKNTRRELKKPLTAAGKEGGETLGAAMGPAAGKAAGRTMRAPLAAAGAAGGRAFGKAAVRAASKSTREGSKKTAADFLKGFGETLTGGMATVFRSAFTAGPILVAAAGLSAALSAAVGAAVTTGVLAAVGGGVLAAGIALAVKHPAVSKAWETFGSRAKKVFAGFSQPFRAPLIRAADTFGDALERMAPSLRKLGQLAAPLIDKLAPSLATMAENAMPGLLAAMKAAGPVLGALDFGAIGKGISGFFTNLSAAGPEAARFMSGFSRALSGGLPALAGHLASLTKKFFQIVDVGRDLGALVAPVFSRIRDAVVGFFNSAKSGDGILARLKGYFATLREPLANLGETFREIGTRLSGVWKSQLQPFFTDLGKKLGPLFSEWGETIRSVITDLTPIVRGIADGFAFLWTKLGLGKVVLGMIGSFFSGMVKIVTGAIRIVRGLFTLFAGIFTGDWSKMWEGVKTIASGIWSAICGAFQVLIIGRLGSMAKGLLGRLGVWFTTAFSKIKNAAASWVTSLVGRVAALRSSVTSYVSGLVSRVVSYFTSMMSRALSAVRSGVGRVVSAVRDMGTRMLAPLRDLVGRFRSIASDVIGGFVAGIRAGAGRIISAIKSTITDNLPSYVKAALGIHSPSRVFMALGRHVSEGMALGIRQGSGAVTKAVSALTKIPDAASVNVGTFTARSAGLPTAAEATHYHLHDSRATLAQLQALQARQAILARAGRAR